MAAFSPRKLACVIGLTGGLACVSYTGAMQPAPAAEGSPAPQQETMEEQAPPDGRSVSWSADVLNSDFRSDTLELAGNVRVMQGAMSIQAHSATAVNVSSDPSEWTFTQDVRIRTAQADLRADSATASIVHGQIAKARISGAPAEFEQRVGGPEGQVRGRAGVIDYDFNAGVVRLEKDVWFTNGVDEFTGDVVIYDVRQERVQINPQGESSGRVRGVIRPRERGAGVDRPRNAAGPQDARARDGDGA